MYAYQKTKVMHCILAMISIFVCVSKFSHLELHRAKNQAKLYATPKKSHSNPSKIDALSHFRCTYKFPNSLMPNSCKSVSMYLQVITKHRKLSDLLSSC